MTEVALFQLGLALEGFFVRGGIAVGKTLSSIDEDIAYGIGLFDALFVPKEKQDVPRIVLAESAVAYVKKHLQYYASVHIAPHDDALLIDEDKHHFINYLDSVWPDHTESPDYISLASIFGMS